MPSDQSGEWTLAYQIVCFLQYDQILSVSNRCSKDHLVLIGGRFYRVHKHILASLKDPKSKKKINF